MPTREEIEAAIKAYRDFQVGGYWQYKAAMEAALTAAEQVRGASEPDIPDLTIQQFGEMAGNFLRGHGWTGFGPTPEQIEEFLRNALPAAPTPEKGGE